MYSCIFCEIYLFEPIKLPAKHKQFFLIFQLQHKALDFSYCMVDLRNASLPALYLTTLHYFNYKYLVWKTNVKHFRKRKIPLVLKCFVTHCLFAKPKTSKNFVKNKNKKTIVFFSVVCEPAHYSFLWIPIFY